jgi:predicted small metal-binding protein
MKRNLKCPCGVLIQGVDEDDLVDKANEHLREEHPQLQYEREQILFMAY